MQINPKKEEKLQDCLPHYLFASPPQLMGDSLLKEGGRGILHDIFKQDPHPIDKIQRWRTKHWLKNYCASLKAICSRHYKEMMLLCVPNATERGGKMLTPSVKIDFDELTATL